MSNFKKNGGWKFVTNNDPHAYRMYGFPTKKEFNEYIGYSEAILIPIHYDMCLSVELIDIFLSTECVLEGESQIVIDCFYDPINAAPTDFIKQKPMLMFARDFLEIHT